MTDNREPIHQKPVEREVADELGFHLDMRVRDLLARGTDPDEARRIAEAELGDLAGMRSELTRIGTARNRRVARARWFFEMGQDLRFALRLLWRRRSFATLATLTIALGIGAATAIYTVVDSVLLRPLPFADSGKLVAVWIRQPELAKTPSVANLADATPFGSEEYIEMKSHNRVFQDVALWSISFAPVQLPGATPQKPEMTRIYQVSSSLLNVLRERVALGRGFLPGEDVFNGPKVALATWDTWRTRFGGDSSAIGRQVLFDDTAYTLVGVLPADLKLTRQPQQPAYWVPALQRRYDLPQNHNRSYQVVARLKDSVPIADAERDAARLVRAATGDSTIGARVEGLQADETRKTRGPLLMVFAAAGLLLLIACVNVATLTLGEAAAREQEIAARIALGAGAARLVRQLLTESLAIAVAGAVLGGALAWALTRLLVSGAPIALPGLDVTMLNLRVLGFSVLCAAGTGILFGLAPAASLIRSGAVTMLRAGGQSIRGAGRLQRMLVAVETGLSVVLLVAAALLVRSLWNVAAVDPGFDARGVTTIQLSVPRTVYNGGDQAMIAHRRLLLERLGALPGITAISSGSSTAFTGNNSSSPVWVTGHPHDASQPRPFALQHAVTPGYFELLGIPVRAGRTFTPADAAGAEDVVIVNEALARRDFPGGLPLDQHVDYQGRARRIVGVVGDVRSTGLTKDTGPEIFVPYPQHTVGETMILVRSTLEMASLAQEVRAAVREIDPDISVLGIQSMPKLIAGSYEQTRYRALLVAAFGGFAILLTAIGLYGVTVRSVARRTREVGIRVALGSSAAGVRTLLMKETFAGVALGAAIGLPAAWVFALRIAPYLFGIQPADALSFGAVTGVLAGVAAMASFLPARRATRISPAAALRND